MHGRVPATHLFPDAQAASGGVWCNLNPVDFMGHVALWRKRARRWTGILLAALVSTGPAFGQFRQVHTPEHLETGQTANLFAVWEGRTALDGVYLELPLGWTLRGVRSLRYGYEPMPVEMRPAGAREGVYVVSFPEVFKGACELIFEVKTGDFAGTVSWALTPFTRGRRQGRVYDERRDIFRVTEHAYVNPAHTGDNRALAFEARDGGPVLLRREALPDLGMRAPYTVEFWLNTVDLDEVVLSTWDGDEQTSYPLEIVVDVSGRLFVYHGRPGQHLSMMTRQPIADGQWHHVAVTHEPADGWSRLFVDGAASDSLFFETMPDIDVRTPVALGGRVPGAEAGATMRPFTGMIDELRFWPRARPPAEIRQTMNQPLRSHEREVVALGFEDALPEAIVERRSPRAVRRFSDLDFYLPIRRLHGTVENGAVLLTWETQDRQTVAFIVERSEDGRHFEEIGRVAARDAQGPEVESEARFSFRDTGVTGRVLYYRIRQRFESGVERISSTIKMGMGAEEEQKSAVLIGNFPNPFNPATTIAYTLRKAQHVRLSVWDLSGQQVALLVDESEGAGYYEVSFHAGELPSGTYFIHMQTDEGVQTRKMILMK